MMLNASARADDGPVAASDPARVHPEASHMTLLNRIRDDASAAELPATAVFHSLITDALLAAPAFTTQRWRFRIAGEALDLSVDPAPHGSSARDRIMSCGVALALLGVAARHRGVALQIRSRLDSADRLATLRICERVRPQREDHALFRGMMRSETWRQVSFDLGVRQDILDELRRVSARRGARFEVVRGNPLTFATNDGLSTPSLVPLEPPSDPSVQAALIDDAPVGLLGPTFAAVVTPGDQPHDWLAAGEAKVILELTGARHGVHVASVASATPIIRALRPRVRALLRDPGEAQAVLMLGHGLRRTRQAKASERERLGIAYGQAAEVALAH
jgi:hypothetical protein